MSENEKSSLNRRRESKILEFGTPRLYLENPFRLTGLPITATDRELKLRYQRFEMDEKLGGGFNFSTSLLPTSEPVDWDVLRRAQQQLNDPEVRLIYELFWFWPARSVEDKYPLELLSAGRIEESAKAWREQEQSDSANIVAIHNLAVLYHILSLEPEGSMIVNSEADRKRYWSGALERWKLLQENQSFWDQLLDRVNKIDNPRLTYRIVDQIREDLPATLLSINAQIAVRKAQNDLGDDARWHKDLITYSGFDQEVIRRSLWSVMAPIQHQIEVKSQSLIREVDANPRRGKRAITDFLDQMKPYVNAVDCLLSEDDGLRIEVHNHIANTALASAITFGNETSHWTAVRELLLRSLRIVMGAELKQRIRRNLKTVEDRI